MNTTRATAVRVLTVLVPGLMLPGIGFTQEFYDWNSKTQPPVALDQALRKAQESVGNEYYCTSAHLYGDKIGSAASGRWAFTFGAEDGSAKGVQIDAEGHLRVDTYVQPLPSHLKSVKGLSDVKNVFEEFLREQDLEGAVTFGEVVTMSVRTRSFQIHEMLESGDWSTETTLVTGPQSDGFVVRVYKDVSSRQPAIIAEGYAVYWLRAENVFRIDEASVIVEIDYGPKVPPQLVRRLFNIFPELGTE